MKTLILAVVGLGLLTGTNASATTRTLTGYMTGSQEVVPTGSTATGGCKVVVDDVAHTLTMNGSFTGLAGAATEIQVHAGAVGEEGAVLVDGTPGLVRAPRGQFTFSETVSDPSTFSQILSALLSGNTYCNLHSQGFTEGEIRGQVALISGAPAVPNWGLWLLGVGLACVGAALVARRTQSTKII